MLQRFYPDYYYNSTYEIDFQYYYNMGIRGIIFDIDNTLVPHGADADERAIALFKRLRETGFSTCLLSNNKEPRVMRFNEIIQSEYIFKAGKPGRKGYQRAMECMGTTIEQTMFVGDQLFTDVWGAKMAGMTCVLVCPIHPQEEIQIVLKRYLERIVLRSFGKKKDTILIGFMGTGKSTVGKLLAQRQHRLFIDTDDYIEAKEGRSISDIFEQEGEDYFRSLETSILKELKEVTHNAVIATGGGLPLRQENAELLSQMGEVIYLQTSVDTIWERLKGDTKRPLLCTDNPRERIEQLLLERDRKYETASQKKLVTDGLSAEEIVAILT